MRLCKYFGAGMILYTKDTQGNIHVLLRKRADNHTWAIPRGHLDDLEDANDYKKAARREAYEETGTLVKSSWCVAHYELPYFSYWTYASRLDNQETAVKNWESDAIEWFSIEELPEGMNWMTEIAIKDFIRREKNHVE